VELVGRGRELAALDRLFDSVAAGTGGTIAITGPDGIGKTALLTAAARRAGQRGFSVLRLAVTQPGLARTCSTRPRVASPAIGPG